MTRRTTVTTLSLLAVLALSARLGMMVYLKAWNQPNAMEHKSVATSLAGGRGFWFADWKYYGPTSVQSPPMPFLLAGLFKVFGAVSDGPNSSLVLDPTRAARAYTTVMVINAFAGAGLVWLTYAAARAVGATAAAGVGAAALVAVWPTQVYAAASVQAISLITCAVAAMVALYYRAVRSGSAGDWTAFAVVGTLAALTEPVFLPALFATGLLVLFARSPLAFGPRVRNAAILAFTVAAIIGPWAARNYVVQGALIPVKGSTWVNVWKGNNDYATGTDRVRLTPAEKARIEKIIKAGGDRDKIETEHQYVMLDLSQQMALRSQPEAKREALFRKYAVDWIKAHPAGYARLCGVRVLKTLTVDWDNPQSVYKSYLLARAAVLLMTVGGLWVAWRQRWSLAFPAVVVGCALLTYTLTVTAARFAFPFEPLQLILGAGLVTAAAGRFAAAPKPIQRRGDERLLSLAAAH